MIPDLVARLTTDNNGDAQEEDHATHGIIIIIIIMTACQFLKDLGRRISAQ